MGTRKRLSSVDAKALILEAAAKSFCQNGLSTTVEDIAQEAGYSTSALYKHFESRAAILEALAAKVKQRMESIYNEELPIKLCFEDRLRWVMGRLTHFAKTEPSFFIAIQTTTPIASHGDQPRELIQEFTKFFTALVQEGIDEGVLGDTYPAGRLAKVLVGNLNAAAAEWARNPSLSLDKIQEDSVSIFLNGARRRD